MKNPATPNGVRHAAERLAVAQRAALETAARSGLSLSKCLRESGAQMDDLRYLVRSTPSAPAESVPRFRAKPRLSAVPVVSFFSGAGGMDIGFESAGFEHVALFENNGVFCRTLRVNRQKWPVVGPPDDAGDVSNLEETASILKDRFSVRPGFEGVFVGGPPCQPFSIAANQRFKKTGKNFKRIGYAHQGNGMLLFDFGAVIRMFRPRVFMVENVPGLLDVDGGRQLSAFCRELAGAGYRISAPAKLDAEHFGVPQRRGRLFIVGRLGDAKWTPPAPSQKSIPCGAALTDDVARFPNHEIREHKIASVLRYQVLDFGKRDRLGRVDRLHPFLPSKTVIAGGLVGGGRSHLHPWIPRTLSVRECARLQTFPDKYVFTGPIARQFTQVGNAVPPLLAQRLAESVRDNFYG